MSEYEPFYITIDGTDVEVTAENHGVAMFRDTPEVDYIDLTLPVGPDEEEQHSLIYKHRWLCIWMGATALNQEDLDLLEGLNEAHGTFRDRTGFNSRVMVEDSASEFEREYWIRSQMSDLNRAEGADDLLD